jgi:hypothetical protein
VVVSAVIKSYSTHEVVAGLLLRQLQGLIGPASYSLGWNGSTLDPGYYYVEATIQDKGGNTLAQQTKLFRLGIPGGEITNFFAAPPFFKTGDNIGIFMTFVNTGTTTITGTAVIQIEDGMGNVVEVFHHDILNLAPEAYIYLNDVWDTTGIVEGRYRMVGTVYFDDQASDPKVALVNTYSLSYLPLIRR